jgi:hypothetical protein
MKSITEKTMRGVRIGFITSVLMLLTVATFAVTVTINLKDHTGALITAENGTTSYYSGGWHTIGATSGGTATVDLAPGNYYFNMNFHNYTQQTLLITVTAAGPNVVDFKTVLVTTDLYNHSGTTIANQLSGGTAQYYASGWHSIAGSTVTGASIMHNPQIELLPGNYYFNMTYNYYTKQTVSTPVSGTTQHVPFQTTLVTTNLYDHDGNRLANGAAQFYAGGWHPISGTTATSGANPNIELLPGNYYFNMNYNYYTQQVGSMPISGTTQDVDFTTTLVTLNLKDHNGDLESGGTAMFYAGGWHAITGTTGSSCSTNPQIELLPGNYYFNMNYNYYTQQLGSMPVSGSSQYVNFQTILVSANLKNCAGDLISTSGAAAQFYAGGWHNFPAVSGGTTATELLPGNYYFNMNYNYYTEQSPNTAIGNTPLQQDVDFKTTKVTFSNPNATAITYYSGGWHAFSQPSMELLPGSYIFKTTPAGPNVTKAISGCSQNYYIAPCGSLSVATEDNGGCGGSYTFTAPAGGSSYLWNTGETTQSIIVNDNATHTVTVTYDFACSGAADGPHDYSNSVTVTPNTVTVRLIDSKGNPISGAQVQYYVSSWTNFIPSSTTDANGFACMHFASTTTAYFRVNYLGGNKQWSGISSATNPVLIAQTTNVALNLKDHNSALITAESGDAGYYDGNWVSLGSTGSNGYVKQEFLPGSYYFHMTYHGYTQQQTISVGNGPDQDVNFQTTLVTLNLKDHNGNLIQDVPGTGGYYSDNWHSIGNTTNIGYVQVELLPGSGYYARMTFHGYTQQKALAVLSSPTTQSLDFQTTQVSFNLTDHNGSLITAESGTAGYYSDTWHDFSGTGSDGYANVELLPGTGYYGRMTFHHGTYQKNLTVSSGPTDGIEFQTALITIHFQGNTGIAHSGATINYYGGSWYYFGTTDASGNASMEMLPVPYYYNGTLAGYGTTQVGTFTDASGSTPTHTIQSSLAARLAQVQTQFGIYPNPATNTVTISFNSDVDGKSSVRILDYSGRVVVDKTIVTVKGYNSFALDVSDLASGIYVVKYSNADNSDQAKITIQR